MSALKLTFKGGIERRPSGKFGVGWRWTLTASNGRIVGASTESYRKRLDAVKNAALVVGLGVGNLRLAVEDAVTGYMSSVHRPASPTEGVRVEVQS